MKDEDSKELYEVIRAICNAHGDLPALNPSWLATEAMQVIGFERDLHEVGYLGCHLQFRQIARGFCRKHFSDPDEQEDLFPSTLQQRYPECPQSPNAEPVYTLLDLLSDADVTYNIQRLRKEGRAKLAHADALEDYRDRKFGRVA